MTSSKKKHDMGEYYTPKSIAYYLTKRAIFHYMNKKPESSSLKEFISTEDNGKEEFKEKLENIHILDPACGNGIFLKAATSLLYDLNKEICGRDSISKLPTDSGIINKIFENNIHGVDINKFKIDEFNQAFLNEFNIRNYDQNNFLIKYGNALIEDSKFPSHFNWREEFDSLMNEGGFDIILGNPPWGANMEHFKSHLQTKYPEIASGQFDSFAVFLYKSIKDLLKENGILAFIVPNELCFLEQYANLRKFLLNYTFLELINLGFEIFPDVQKPALLLILKKKRSKNLNHEIKISVDFSNQEKSSFLANQEILSDIINKNHYSRIQNDFLKNKNYLFDIFSDPIDKRIISKIKSNGFKSLGNYFRSGRGVDTNKKGKYFICPHCRSLNPPFGRGHSGRKKKKICQSEGCDFLFEKQKSSIYETVELISDQDFPQEGYNAQGYIGEDLGKLHFKRNPRAIKYFPLEEKIKSNEILYNCSNVMWGRDDLYYGEKLLIRKVSTGHNLQIMIYEGDLLVTNQQIYIFKKRKNIADISLYYFLGILISRLIHYYYINNFGDPYKKVLPHFTQSNLMSLPLAIISKKDKRYHNLVDLVKILILLVSKYQGNENKSERYNSSEIFLKIQYLYSELDKILFSLYNISDDTMQQEIINRANAYGFKLI